ncbi:MAG: UPF0158 family protein [Legionellaceae bacterium]|nr:UPF0158 family protein [Legionellaceae bacterium]
MNKLKLSDLVDALECYFDEHRSFIDLKNNIVCLISDSALSCAENNDDNYPAWQHEEIQSAKAYLEDHSNFIALPSQYDVNEYDMMENFAFALDDEHQKEKLLIALRGKCAFRRFKDTACFLGIENDWYCYRDKQYKQFMLDWCETNDITIDC